jgi:hypothetical protein
VDGGNALSRHNRTPDHGNSTVHTEQGTIARDKGSDETTTPSPLFTTVEVMTNLSTVVNQCSTRCYIRIENSMSSSDHHKESKKKRSRRHDADDNDDYQTLRANLSGLLKVSDPSILP